MLQSLIWVYREDILICVEILQQILFIYWYRCLYSILQGVQNYLDLPLSHSNDRSGTGTRSVPSSFSVPLIATVLVIFPSNRRISFSIILSFYVNLIHIPWRWKQHVPPNRLCGTVLGDDHAMLVSQTKFYTTYIKHLKSCVLIYKQSMPATTHSTLAVSLTHPHDIQRSCPQYSLHFPSRTHIATENYLYCTIQG